MRLSDKITKDLMDRAKVWSYDIVIPNFYVWEFEMDLFKMTWTWYIIEYEIKISRADFFNDFKKKNKHERLKNWLLDTNRFYFVVPEWLIKEDEVPEYCWLIYAKTNWWKFYYFKTIKNAKLLHKNKKIDDIKYVTNLLHKVSFREKLKQQKIWTLKNKIIDLKKEINDKSN